MLSRVLAIFLVTFLPVVTMPNIVNAPAPGIPYYTPSQYPAAGTAVDPQPDGKPIPTLFKPLTIRGVEFQNRLWVSLGICLRIGLDTHPYFTPRTLYVVVAYVPVLCGERSTYGLALRSP